MNIYANLALAGPGDGWGHMRGDAWPGWMLLSAVLFTLFTLGVAALVIAVVARQGRPGAGAGGPDRIERGRGILAERYARGEIDTEEYRERLSTLTGASGTGPRTPAEPG